MIHAEAPFLSGENVALRAREPADVPILQADLYEDVATRARADNRPWIPIPADPRLSPYAVPEVSDTAALFSIVAVADGELAGEAVLWSLDTHNRSANLGLALRPIFRGRGWSVETLLLLCRYGFTVRGLNRLQLQTLADNTAMIKAAERAGFRREGVLRQSSWALGSFVDSVLYGLLHAEWDDQEMQASPTRSQPS